MALRKITFMTAVILLAAGQSALAGAKRPDADTTGVPAQPTAFADCGRTFLELPAELPEQPLVWAAYGEEFDRFFDVTAYSNGNDDGDDYYQCTELVHRFTREVYGIPTKLGMGLGHGKSVAENVAKHFSGEVGMTPRTSPYQIGLEFFRNGQSICRPVVGAIVSLNFRKYGKYGHVAIIRHLKETPDGQLEATLFEQHGMTNRPAGSPMESGKLIFVEGQDGRWDGKWIIADRFEQEVVGWTNPVILGTETADSEAERP